MTGHPTFDYEAQPKEFLSRCNLCGATAEPLAVRETRDRYGFPISVTECACGLVFLNPRMTAEAYRRFYEDGTYRRLVSAYHGREIDAHTIQAEQRVYAEKLADFLAPHISADSVLDVGGSTGVVGRLIADRFHLAPTILDPAPAELAEAGEAERVMATIEEWEPGERKWGLILLCQTVDHLLDIWGALKKLRSVLEHGGCFFVDALNYEVGRTLKIDHPYSLTEATLTKYLRRAGFASVGRRVTETHIGFVCR